MEAARLTSLTVGGGCAAKYSASRLEELLKKLNSDRSYVYLKRQVEMDVVAKIEKLGIEGIDTRKEYL